MSRSPCAHCGQTVGKLPLAALCDACADRLGADSRSSSIPRHTYAAELLSFAALRSERVPWAWKGYLSYGAVTSLSGRPKVGKGTFYCWLAARVTTGQLDGDDRGQPRGVLILTSEDALSWALKPRLQVAGADMTRVYAPSLNGDAFRIPRDLAKLSGWVKEYDIALVVIDPLVEFIDGKADTHKSAETRQALAPLTSLAQELRLAVLAVYHLNKGRGTDPLLRQEGSNALTQITRGGLFIGHDPDDAEGADGPRRILAPLPTNLSRPMPSLQFTIDSRSATLDDGSTESVPVVTGMGEVSRLSAADLLADHTEADDQRSAIGDAAHFLTAKLADGPQLVPAIEAAAQAAGIAWRTVQRAASRLDVQKRKTGGRGAAWEWSLPKMAQEVGGHTVAVVGSLCESPAATGDSQHATVKDGRASTLATFDLAEPGAAIAYPNRCTCADSGIDGPDSRCGRCYGHRLEAA